MSPAHLSVDRHAQKRVRPALALLLTSLLSVALLGLAMPSTASAAAPVTGAPASTPATAKSTVRPVTIRTPSVRKAAKIKVRSKILRTAASRAGTPYRYGGTGVGGFDCSGYTRWVFARMGIALPRTSAAQAAWANRVRVPRPGDLVFFSNGGRVYHVAIYAGARKVWHSPYTGARVRKERIWTGSVFYGRVKGMKKVLNKTAKKIVKARNAAMSS